MGSIIYHVVAVSDWQLQKVSDFYEHPSLVSEGFIHCCTEAQIEGVLDRYFDGVHDLLLLSIDLDLVVSDVLFEVATEGEKYPHVYGSVEKAAIVNIEKIR